MGRGSDSNFFVQDGGVAPNSASKVLVFAMLGLDRARPIPVGCSDPEEGVLDQLYPTADCVSLNDL